MEFDSLDAIRAVCRDLPQGNAKAQAAAEMREGQLTKPPGSLGELEALAAWLALWQGRAEPRLDNVTIAVFAGNHGVAARGVSAFPADVTAQMVQNFAHGGAAINQLAKAAGAELKVTPLSLETSTADFTAEPAMSEGDFLSCVNQGAATVALACDLLVVGEMGIGNTCVAAALCAALLGGGAAHWTGRGTGVDDAGLARKQTAIELGLARHRDVLADPLSVARALGGRELAAIFGAVLAARLRRVPVLLDGFVTAAAVLPLAKLAPDALGHCRAGHVSAEAGHRLLLRELGLKPLLDLGLRLGEASGAALAIPLLRGALACHAGMATFAEAGVSDKN
ncbi:nicotinate-nucleotide--dimethylbenzimidazole phosphoribosyltransferase [Bradyrhizobium sp. WD16]|uniref:nicotinate-nucleotide--dimethylbenzimidazole phosphoribosyltransferase n=1 Tax=Bradyrhizobium sp. WD16 TaxID=1521768 RepID=UPI0020A60CCD|nr:nicotinate-nucleotide--dimethylbenzimidazole phosphoribosyltransferase [Bradyrhizobium sp. WD16]UTD26475.1 nicotinate-nucleotide--dimethylbenzimidazole phosphoribosyltransferase [Bradyrhizobium sp. WD16]